MSVGRVRVNRVVLVAMTVIVATTTVGQIALTAIALSGRVPLLTEELYFSQVAHDLRRPDPSTTLLRTVEWVARRLSDDAAYDAAGTPSRMVWLRQGYASCDQQVSLTQQLLYRNSLSSRSLALYGESPVSRHTVLEAFLPDRDVVVDPYLGWMLRDGSGRLARTGDVADGDVRIDIIDPDDYLAGLPLEEYVSFFRGPYPAQVLGRPLGSVYNLRYKALIRWSVWTAGLLRLASIEIPPPAPIAEG